MDVESTLTQKALDRYLVELKREIGTLNETTQTIQTLKEQLRDGLARIASDQSFSCLWVGIYHDQADFGMSDELEDHVCDVLSQLHQIATIAEGELQPNGFFPWNDLD